MTAPGDCVPHAATAPSPVHSQPATTVRPCTNPPCILSMTAPAAADVTIDLQPDGPAIVGTKEGGGASVLHDTGAHEHAHDAMRCDEKSI